MTLRCHLSVVEIGTCEVHEPQRQTSENVFLIYKTARFAPGGLTSDVAKIQNNADIRKQFWRINAVCPINKGNSEKNEESLKVGTMQNYAVR